MIKTTANAHNLIMGAEWRKHESVHLVIFG